LPCVTLSCSEGSSQACLSGLTYSQGALANLDVANTYNNIAGVYKTQGKYEMAYLPLLGPGLLDNASVADLGKYEMALVHYEKCLAIRINVLGENHVDVCKTQLNIAEVHEAVCRGNVMRCRAIAAVHSVAADTRFLEESRAAEEASAEEASHLAATFHGFF
jgi:hypothetical protein